MLGSMRVSSVGVTFRKVVPVDRACFQKDPKMSVQRVRFYVSARLEEVDFSDFGRIFTPTVFQWSTPLVSSEKYPLRRIAHFPNELWSKKCVFSRFFWPSDTVCLFRSHSQGIAGESVVLLSALASQHNVSNAHWMVAVRFFNLELGPIEFLTHWVQNFRVQNRLFQDVANTVDGNILALVALHVSTTSIGRVGGVPFALECSEWNWEVQKFWFEVSPVISLIWYPEVYEISNTATSVLILIPRLLPNISSWKMSFEPVSGQIDYPGG